ncbi:MAG: hypothetical protein HY537_04480 [Deltaproteobacteria bacterium]|nr:hypothetical protein [Deltaproteobacteria bacterium]
MKTSFIIGIFIFAFTFAQAKAAINIPIEILQDVRDNFSLVGRDAEPSKHRSARRLLEHVRSELLKDGQTTRSPAALKAELPRLWLVYGFPAYYDFGWYVSSLQIAIDLKQNNGKISGYELTQKLYTLSTNSLQTYASFKEENSKLQQFEVRSRLAKRIMSELNPQLSHLGIEKKYPFQFEDGENTWFIGAFRNNRTGKPRASFVFEILTANNGEIYGFAVIPKRRH